MKDYDSYCTAGAVELRNALNDKFGIELSPTVTLDYPSVAALAAHIAEQLSQAAGGIEHDEEVQVKRCIMTKNIVHVLLPAAIYARCLHGLTLHASSCNLQAPTAAAPAPSLQVISAEVQAVVATLVGRAIDPEQPLMEAGLDSLGEFAGIGSAWQ